MTQLRHTSDKYRNIWRRFTKSFTKWWNPDDYTKFGILCKQQQQTL